MWVMMLIGGRVILLIVGSSSNNYWGLGLLVARSTAAGDDKDVAPFAFGRMVPYMPGEQ